MASGERELSPGRTVFFSVFTIALALVFIDQVVALGDDAGVIETTSPDDAVEYLDGALFVREGDQWVLNEHHRRWMLPSSFAVDKGETPRVFVVGGSFAMGTPFVHQEWSPEGDAASIPEQLRREFNGIEVLNLAAGAQNSGKVREITQDALQHEPDLLVIATCNNEGVLPRSEVDRRLRQSAGYRMLQHIVSGPYEGPRPQHTPQDPDVEAVREAFRENLRAMIADAEAAGVPIILATLPVNLRYADTDAGHVIDGFVAPERGPRPPNHDANPFRRTTPEEAEELLAELSHESVEDLRTAGLLLVQAERFDEARAALEQYTELMPRNRCRPSFNEVIRAEAAAASGVTLVDLDLWARSVAPNGLPGDDLFVDYCHMNEDGYWAAGAEIARVIRENGLLPD